MTDDMNDQNITNCVREYFLRNPDANIVAVYVFGSVARGTSRPDSDVDVGVLYSVAPPATLEGLPFDLQANLESVLKKVVQIVVLNGASADFVHNVLRDGDLVYETDRSKRIRFEMRSRQVYLDLLPVRRQYRRRVGGVT